MSLMKWLAGWSLTLSEDDVGLILNDGRLSGTYPPCSGPDGAVKLSDDDGSDGAVKLSDDDAATGLIGSLASDPDEASLMTSASSQL